MGSSQNSGGTWDPDWGQAARAQTYAPTPIWCDVRCRRGCTCSRHCPQSHRRSALAALDPPPLRASNLHCLCLFTSLASWIRWAWWGIPRSGFCTLALTKRCECYHVQCFCFFDIYKMGDSSNTRMEYKWWKFRKKMKMYVACRVLNFQLHSLLSSALRVPQILCILAIYSPLSSTSLILFWHCGFTQVVSWVWNSLLSHLWRLSFKGDLNSHIFLAVFLSAPGGNIFLRLELQLSLAFLFPFCSLAHPHLSSSRGGAMPQFVFLSFLWNLKPYWLLSCIHWPILFPNNYYYVKVYFSLAGIKEGIHIYWSRHHA